MKKRYFLIPAAIIILVLFSLYKERLVLDIACANIKKTLPISKVQIEKVEFHPLSSLRLQGISIKSPLQRYSIYLENINVDFTLASILQGAINRVEISGIDVSISENIKVNPGKAVFKVREIKAAGSIKLRDIEIKNFQVQLYQLDGIGKSSQNNFKGNLSAEAVKAKEIKLSDFSAVLEYAGDTLNLPEFKVNAFGGEIKGEAKADISKGGINFSAHLRGKDIDLAQLDEDLNLKEKFEVTGLCDFSLNAKGDNSGLTELSGDLNTHEGGGKFVLTDKQSLSKIDFSREASFDLALESLKNYQYDKGNAEIYIEDGSIVLHMLMDGPAGARDLMVVYHGALKFGRRF